MKKHIKRISILIISITFLSLLVGNLNVNNKQVVEIYKAQENGMYKDFYLDKGDLLTVYNDNSYVIKNINGIIVNQE